jgi:hypothetical protein
VRLQPYLIFLFVIFTTSAFGQAAKVQGKVSNDRGEGLDGVAILYRNQSSFTNEEGRYQIEIPPNQSTTIIFSLIGYDLDTLVFSPPKASNYTRNIVLRAKENVLNEVSIVDQTKRTTGGISIKPRELEFNAGPLSTVEGLIKTLPGVVSRSELSSQYSVRGGSFDENLVYVNGIEVYRPFLARSGQQEGLSFVNSDLIQDIYFSAGGFPARYGDKMSSVLDIKYRKAEPFGVRAQASLLGGSLTAEGRTLNQRLGIVGSIRYRTNQLLLGSTDLEADYRPRFTDIQTLISYELTDEWDIEFLGSYARNNFQVIPQTS